MPGCAASALISSHTRAAAPPPDASAWPRDESRLAAWLPRERWARPLDEWAPPPPAELPSEAPLLLPRAAAAREERRLLRSLSAHLFERWEAPRALHAALAHVDDGGGVYACTEAEENLVAREDVSSLRDDSEEPSVTQAVERAADAVGDWAVADADAVADAAAAAVTAVAGASSGGLKVALLWR